MLVSAMITGAFFTFPLVLSFVWFSYSKLHPKNMTGLVQQVLESNPGLDIVKWDEIANRLNSFFYQEHIWNTPHSFYDGQHVQRVFKDNVLKPYLEGKFEDITDADKTQSARCYLQSLKEKFELLLKDNLPEFFLNSELPRDTHRNKFFSYRGYLFMRFLVCWYQFVTLLKIVTAFNLKSFFPLVDIIYCQYMS
ncbi:hypothetical protein LQ764DRAFT_235581 [Zygosaccharomyces rouxii]|nr:hypothetical protein LQ764DRAFT_235581 [Zygosaccharomyces rouxii]